MDKRIKHDLELLGMPTNVKYIEKYKSLYSAYKKNKKSSSIDIYKKSGIKMRKQNYLTLIRLFKHKKPRVEDYKKSLSKHKKDRNKRDWELVNEHKKFLSDELVDINRDINIRKLKFDFKGYYAGVLITYREYPKRKRKDKQTKVVQHLNILIMHDGSKVDKVRFNNHIQNFKDNINVAKIEVFKIEKKHNKIVYTNPQLIYSYKQPSVKKVKSKKVKKR